MEEALDSWLEALRAKRERWVDASDENDFNRGIWNATVEKYADPSHFIFELLQNAEDAGASSVHFTLEPDRIVTDGRSTVTISRGSPASATRRSSMTGTRSAASVSASNRSMSSPTAPRSIR
jgi:hypothetical protein